MFHVTCHIDGRTSNIFFFLSATIHFQNSAELVKLLSIAKVNYTLQVCSATPTRYFCVSTHTRMHTHANTCTRIHTQTLICIFNLSLFTDLLDNTCRNYSPVYIYLMNVRKHFFLFCHKLFANVSEQYGKVVCREQKWLLTGKTHREQRLIIIWLL